MRCQKHDFYFILFYFILFYCSTVRDVKQWHFILLYFTLLYCNTVQDVKQWHVKANALYRGQNEFWGPRIIKIYLDLKYSSQLNV